MPRKMTYDRWLFLTPCILLLGGMAILGSASMFVAMRYEFSSSNYFLYRQIGHAIVGIGLMFGAMTLPYRRLAEQKFVIPILMVAVLSLVAVLFFEDVNGSKRWIDFGVFRLQPSEFVKIGVIILLASILSRKEDRINELPAVVIPVAILVVPIAILVYVEPDLGTALIILGTAALLLFAAGLKYRYILAAAVAGAIPLAAAIIMKPYRVQRVVEYLSGNVAGQSLQSQIAIGSGGLLGVGLGRGGQQAYFLPEAHTDFIFAVIGEQLGLLGSLAVLASFLILLWRGLRTTLRAPDRFGFYLALGITCLLSLQAFTNMAVCVGLVPTTGLALPFVSYGGSSLLASLTALGLLINVSQHSN